jgi:predicted Zn-dependent peptidase
MLDEKLIQSGIGIDVHHDGVCGYVKVTANTENPEAFTEYVSQKFLALNTFLLDEETLERYKKAMVGNFIKALNSFEFMSIGYVEYLFKNCDLLEAPNIQEQLSLHYLRNVQKYFVKECLTSFMIVPKTK